MQIKEKPTLSFIVPLKDEAPSLKELHERIAEQANEHSRAWEILFIDDGSDDNSWDVIHEIANEDPDHVKALRFRRNRTKAPALATGYKEACGEFIFTLDADLQDDPKEIPRFLEKITEGEGWDIVSGYKATRHDPWHKVLPSRVFNAMLSKVNGVNLHDHNCGFKCYRQQVVKNLPMYGEMHRMVPSLASIEGYRTTEIVVEHHARQHGVSKYGVKRFLRGFLDMWSVFFVKTYRERPLHFAGLIALLCVIFAAILGLTSLIPIIPNEVKMAMLSAAPASFFAAPVCIVIGFLAELITNRHYKEGIRVPIVERIEIQKSASDEKIVPISEVTPPSSSTPPRALIADDDTVTSALSSRILKEAGWEVSVVTTGKEALSNLLLDVHVAIIDIYLPGLSGLEILPKINTLAPTTQVVVLAGTDNPTDGAKAIKAGGFDFVSKPIRKEKLLKTMNAALDTSIALKTASKTNKLISQL